MKHFEIKRIQLTKTCITVFQWSHCFSRFSL